MPAAGGQSARIRFAAVRGSLSVLWRFAGPAGVRALRQWWHQASTEAHARAAAGAASAAWLTAAALGLFSGGASSLPLGLALIYLTGIALLVLVWLAFGRVRQAAERRARRDEAQALRTFLEATSAAREEFLSALVPAGATGTPEVQRALAPSRAASAAAPRTQLLPVPAATAPAVTATRGPGTGSGPRPGAALSPVKSAIRKNAVRKSRPAGTAGLTRADLDRAA